MAFREFTRSTLPDPRSYEDQQIVIVESDGTRFVAFSDGTQWTGLTSAQATALAAIVGAGPYTAGTLAGTPTADFSIAADTGERLDSVWVFFNATDDLQAADLVLAKTPNEVLYGREGFDDVFPSQTGRIYSVAIVGLASTTYAAGHSVSAAESTAETIRGALYLIDAPTAIEARYVKVAFTPVLVAGVLNSVTLNVTFAP